MKKKNMVFMAPTKITKEQREFLVKRGEETGNSMSVIVRGLIKAEMDKEVKK